jgi:hypothetical protein
MFSHAICMKPVISTMELIKFNYAFEVYQNKEKVSFCFDGGAQIKCDRKITQGAVTTKDGDAHHGLGARKKYWIIRGINPEG